MNVNVSGTPMDEREVKHYVDRAIKKYGDNLESIDIHADSDEEVTLKYVIRTKAPFERIRRITGYLVGTLDKWNDAKRAEEKERVKHDNH